MTCTRCHAVVPVGVLQGGAELCRRCADLPRETEPPPPRGKGK